MCVYIYIYSSEKTTVTFQNDMILYKSEQLLIFIKQQSIIKKKGEITVV